MALRKTRRFRTCAFAIALVVTAGVSATSGSAWARGGWGSHQSGGWDPRDLFAFFGNHHNRQASAVDYSKAPPPRKLETPPSKTVVVVGDSLADWIAYGLDEFYADQPEIGIERKIGATSGLIRYDAKNDHLDWWQVIKDAVASEKPDAIVVMLGLNDRVSLRDKTPPPPQTKRPGEPAQGTNQGASQPRSQPPQDNSAASEDTEAPPQDAAQADPQRPAPGGSYDFRTDQWAELYRNRIDEMIASLKSTGVPVIWVGLPAIRGTKSTSDIGYLDELYRECAEKAGIVYVDVWDGFVDDLGRYAVEGPDFEGQTRQLRTADGVHFTKAGAVKLASYVDRDLHQVLSNRIVPVAVPGPETTPKSGPAGGRPDVGPVLPLSTGGGEHGDLLGAGDNPTQMVPDPMATEVLSRGEALPAPTGRADDFSWPRRDTPEARPPPVAMAPGKQDAAANDDSKNPTDAENAAAKVALSQH